MTKEKEIETKLQAEFLDENGLPYLKWRVLGKSFKKDKKDYHTYIPYIQVPHMVARLNEVLGFMNWDNVYDYHSDSSTKCEIAVRVEGKETRKTGIGTAHSSFDGIDKDKTKEADSFKRAAAKLGIGNYYKDMSVELEVKIVGGKVICAYTSDGKELNGNNEISDYINHIPAGLSQLRQIARLIPDNLKPEFIKIWEYLKTR